MDQSDPSRDRPDGTDTRATGSDASGDGENTSGPTNGQQDDHATLSDQLPEADIQTLTAAIEQIESSLADHFEATETSVDTYGDGFQIRLEFEGFATIEDALERFVEVMLELRDDGFEVSGGVNSEGRQGPDGEGDYRPCCWVRADVEAAEEVEGP